MFSLSQYPETNTPMLYLFQDIGFTTLRVALLYSSSYQATKIPSYVSPGLPPKPRALHRPPTPPPSPPLYLAHVGVQLVEPAQAT